MYLLEENEDEEVYLDDAFGFRDLLNSVSYFTLLTGSERISYARLIILNSFDAYLQCLIFVSLQILSNNIFINNRFIEYISNKKEKAGLCFQFLSVPAGMLVNQFIDVSLSTSEIVQSAYCGLLLQQSTTQIDLDRRNDYIENKDSSNINVLYKSLSGL